EHSSGVDHVRESLQHFLEREFVALLEQSHCWRAPQVTVDFIHLATNRIRVAFGCADLGDADLVVEFDERAGRLLVHIAEPGWLLRLDNEQRRVLVNALIGLDKLAGVHFVREQIESTFPSGLAYDEGEHGLTLWPRDSFAAEVTYDLSAEPVLSPRLRFGCFPMPLPTIPAVPFLLAKAPVTWTRWVEAWQKDECGKGHPKAV